MIEVTGDVFADTVFWLALVVKQDQYHNEAQEWSERLPGSIVTTRAVLLETFNALSRPTWRVTGIALLERLEGREDVEIVSLTDSLWNRGRELFCSRNDKAWSLTDCMSFVTMSDRCLMDALTADTHFQQAGYRALMLDTN
jgi:predicted nucleic acid-binding protein